MEEKIRAMLGGERIEVAWGFNWRRDNRWPRLKGHMCPEGFGHRGEDQSDVERREDRSNTGGSIGGGIADGLNQASRGVRIWRRRLE